MNFFRMRFTNTLLLFGVGILIGFMLKEKFDPAADLPNVPAYQSAYTPGDRAGRPEGATGPAAGGPASPASEEDDSGAYDASSEEDGSSSPAPQDSSSVNAETSAASSPALSSAAAMATTEPAIVIEPDRVASQPERGQEAAFFRNPASFQGRELQMPLQVITASKAVSGWRLNLVYTGPQKTLDYLYIDDTDGTLGAAPDLRMGYVYDVRFVCGSGLTDSGNKLVSIKPTGQKAAWATGMSAVE